MDILLQNASMTTPGTVVPPRHPRALIQPCVTVQAKRI